MDKLLKAAQEAAQRAYAPYSNFRVGAAVETQDGLIVEGNNQEAASYSLTLCAERVALSALFSANPDALPARIAIFALDAPYGVVRPCGACREYIAQCAMRSGIDIEVVMADHSMPISQLLPDNFRPLDLLH